MPVKKCVCSNVSTNSSSLLRTSLVVQCEAHLGFVFDDGPPPLGLRYQINSAAMTFELKPWFQIPAMTSLAKRKIIKYRAAQIERMGLYSELLKDETHMKLGTYKDRLREAARALEIKEAEKKKEEKTQV